ncbi:MAG: ROK family protein [Gammaproteobacteria bacterium]|nr:ROK family protein [Gammaproteobacteria bacterium]MBV8403870.1 ROK family protein [Gammaproteobacteria bacterium]
MSDPLFAGVETGGTKILARIVDVRGRALAEGRWPTTTPEAALADLTTFLASATPGRPLAAIGIAAFGPLVCDELSPDYGRVLQTPKANWSGSNLRAALAGRFPVPVVIDTDVNAAARAEWQRGAGQGVRCLAYVTVGTGIGGGLLMEGRPLHGALHPEIGHLRLTRRDGDDTQSVCPFHSNCAEGLTAGPAIARRLGIGRTLSSEPAILELVAGYLGELAASLVLSWSPERIIWGGGVMTTPGLLERLRGSLEQSLAGYGVGEAASAADFCALPALADSGLEGALLMAQGRP